MWYVWWDLNPQGFKPATLEITEFTNFSTDTAPRGRPVPKAKIFLSRKAQPLRYQNRDDRTRTYNNNFGDYDFTIKVHLASADSAIGAFALAAP